MELQFMEIISEWWNKIKSRVKQLLPKNKEDILVEDHKEELKKKTKKTTKKSKNSTKRSKSKKKETK